MQEIQGKSPPAAVQRAPRCQEQSCGCAPTCPRGLQHTLAVLMQIPECKLGKGVNKLQDCLTERIFPTLQMATSLKSWKKESKGDCWQKVCVFQSVFFLNSSESQTIIKYSCHLDLNFNMTLILFITLQFKINPQGQHTWL